MLYVCVLVVEVSRVDDIVCMCASGQDIQGG